MHSYEYRDTLITEKETIMLMSIQLKPEDIIFNENGYIVVKLHYYAQWSNGAWICTTEGENMEDYHKNNAKSGKTVFIGGNGGISVG